MSVRTSWVFSCFCVLWLGVLGACVRPPPPPAPARQTNLGLSISTFELANGLRGVLVVDPKATEVQVTMRYQVGSVDDPPEHAGMAHLVEHLMFEQVLGTQSIAARLEQIATYANAYTTFDATTYVARAPASRLDELLSIEAVRIGFRCTSISESVFVREREVVLNELRQRDAVTTLLTAIRESLYPAHHPYRRPVTGTEESVASITREQACAFADAHYATPNAVLVVSGNVNQHQLASSLGKFLGRVARRDGTPPRAVPPVTMSPRQLQAPAPIDDPMLVVAWPLPAAPHERTKVRAVASTVHDHVDGEIRGRVGLHELGDDRAKLLALIAVPGRDESMDDLRASVKRGLEAAPFAFVDARGELARIAFHQVQQGAIYELFSTLEEGGDRDTELAAAVLAGRDPATSLGAEIEGLREMTRAEVGAIARDYLRFDRASVVELTPRDRQRRGERLELAAPIHDRGVRRDSPDLEEARLPAPEVTPPPAFDTMSTRVLPNGLAVVLLPSTSVPTIDVRLIFRAGTADEPAARRGAALLAAHALSWDPRHLNDLLAFASAGGRGLVDVGTDHTAFTARGLDMHVDFLLAGLRRWVRDGRYDRSGASLVEAMRGEAKKLDDEGVLTDAWRTAVFGAGHPYVQAGLVREASPELTLDDAARFRAAYFTPDNATLVIAGRFDAATANRWIDYLFADWTGRAEARRTATATPRPASIGKDEDITQVHLRLALPAGAHDRARHLVAAAMLREIASDVRHQLGASYGLGARLSESRLATHHQIAGWVDAARAAEALELLRARLEQLRTDPEVSARAFIAARARVLTELGAETGSAAMLALRVQRDVERGRAPVSDVATAQAVRILTIDDLLPALADLDLTRAAIAMRGPRADVDRAFAVLGRTPSYVQVTDAERDLRAERAEERSSKVRADAGLPEDDAIRLSDIEDALTSQGPPSRLALAVMPGYTLSRVLGGSASGPSLAAGVGYRIDHRSSVGLRASIGSVEGDKNVGRLVPMLRPIEVVPLGLTVFVHGTGYERLWGGAFLGVHHDRITDIDLPPRWQTSIGVGLEGGVDLLNVHGNRAGLFVRTESELAGEVTYTAVTFGVAYRR